MGRDHSCEVCGTGGFNSEHDEELHRARMVTVRCPVTITSPGPSPGALDMGFKPNEVCGLPVVSYPGEVLNVPPGTIGEWRCPLGHKFLAPIPTEGGPSADR